MQEHTNPKDQKEQKDQDVIRIRGSPIQAASAARQPAASADALRDVHMSLVRAEQNLYNLVQASQASNQAAFGYSAAPAFPVGYAAPAFPPGFTPSNAITTPTFGFATQPNSHGHAPAGFMPTAYAPAPIAYTQPAIGFGPAATAGSWNPLSAVTALPGAIIAGLSTLSGAIAASIAALGNSSTGLPAIGAFPTPSWATANRTPACDISDEGKSFVCHVDLPGVRGEQVDVLCLEQAVVISAYREVDGEAMSLVQSERGIATQQRTIVLPAAVQPGATRATLANGILTVTLPKVNPTEGPRRIKVQG